MFTKETRFWVGSVLRDLLMSGQLILANSIAAFVGLHGFNNQVGHDVEISDNTYGAGGEALLVTEVRLACNNCKTEIIATGGPF